MKKITLLLFLHLSLLTSLTAGTAGKLSGRVIDKATGEPLIGCNVIIDGTMLGASTDIEGNFFILNVPPGVYDVRALMIGYTSVRTTEVQVIVDLTTTVNFVMSTEVIEGEEVTVVAEKPTVRLDQTSMASVLGAEQIANLPVVEITDIIELQAGIVRDAGGGLHVRGGRSGEISFWVDGISTTDSYDGSSIGEDVQNTSIQELQVISGTFNAEYGNAMSGIVNIVTKDGGTKLAGGLELYGGGYHTFDENLFSISSPWSSWNGYDDTNGNEVWDGPEWFNDKNGNQVWDLGEPYKDCGPDMKCPGDNNYPGPDFGEGNGVWDSGEPLNSDVGLDGQVGDPTDNGSMIPSNTSNNNGQKNEPSIGEGDGKAQWGEHRFTLDDKGYIDKLNVLLNPLQIRNFNAFLHGPVPFAGNKLTFYTNVRYFSTLNRFYGKNLFSPYGFFEDEKTVALAPFAKLTGQVKFTYKPSPKLKMSYSLFYTEKKYKNFDTYYKYDPKGLMNRFEKDYSNIFNLTHTLSSKTYYELKMNDFSSSYWEYLYEKTRQDSVYALGEWIVYNVYDTPFESREVNSSSLQSMLDDSISVSTGNEYITIPRYYLIDSTRTKDSTWVYSLIDLADWDGYVDPNTVQVPGWSFARGGTQGGRYERKTTYKMVKFDLSSQINRYNQLKTGFEFKRYDLWGNDKSVDYLMEGAFGFSANGDTVGYNPLGGAKVNPYTPTVYPTYTSSHSYFRTQPKEMAIYVQDKLELDDLILNFGLRFDYFDPDWVVPKDSRFPGNNKYYFGTTPNDTVLFKEYEYAVLHSQVDILDSLTVEGAVKAENLLNSGVSDDSTWQNVLNTYRWVYGYNKVPASYQFSPRIGLSYPITDKGAIHVSYGYFFQIPQFQYLYSNPEFEIGESSFAGILGNAALKPERTVMYEVGVKQEIAPLTSFDFTLFYRDTRDWVGISAPIKKYPVGTYFKYENKDYANTRGFTIAINRAYSSGFGASLDYSWMVAEGTYSNPDDAYHSAQAEESPLQSLIPLNWDQTHTLNGMVTFGGRAWTSSFIAKYWSGTPYTPEFKTGTVSGASAFSGFSENSDRKPNIFILDFRSSYRLTLFDIKLSLFCNIYNLLDTRNERDVWGDTGRSTYTLIAKDVPLTATDRIGQLKEHLLRPDWFSEPRKINIGLNINF